MKVKPVNPYPYLRHKQYRDKRPRLVIEKPGFHAVTIADRGQYQAAMVALVPLEKQGVSPVNAGSLRALIRTYLASAVFVALAKATQGSRHRLFGKLEAELEKIEKEHGVGPWKELKAKNIRALVAKVTGGKVGGTRNLLSAISAMFTWAIDVGMLDDEAHPCRGIKRPKVSKDGWHAWTDEQIEQYRLHHALGTMARLSLELALCSLQRRAELVILGRQHVKDGLITITSQQKTGKPAYVEITPELQAAIDATPARPSTSTKRILNFLLTADGEPFTPGGFTQRMKLWVREAGLTRCPLHGLRKAGARIKVELYGWDILEVQAAGGWASLRDLEIYLKSACRKKAARRGGEKIKAKTARRTQPIQTADTGK